VEKAVAVLADTPVRAARGLALLTLLGLEVLGQAGAVAGAVVLHLL
jgi:hypothetical protein